MALGVSRISSHSKSSLIHAPARRPLRVRSQRSLMSQPVLLDANLAIGGGSGPRNFTTAVDAVHVPGPSNSAR